MMMLTRPKQPDDEAEALLAEARRRGRVQHVGDAQMLKALRRRHRLSIAQLADVLRVYPVALAAWEAGRRPMPAWLAPRIADASRAVALLSHAA